MDAERRRHERYPFTCGVKGEQKGTNQPEPAFAVIGEIVDLSADGAGAIGDRNLAPYSILPWRISVPGVPVALPVLAQVRWVQAVDPEGRAFRYGLTFLS